MYSPVATAGGNNFFCDSFFTLCSASFVKMLRYSPRLAVDPEHRGGSVLAVTPVAESGGMRSSCQEKFR
jgi:hypothetical protein